jgi:hypothetical protein
MSLKFSGSHLDLRLRTIPTENDHEYYLQISSLAFDDLFVPSGQQIVLRANGKSIEIFYQKLKVEEGPT